MRVPLNLYQDNTWYVEDSSREEVLKYAKERDLIPIEKDFYSFDNLKMTKTVFMGTPDILNEVNKEVEKVLRE